MLCYVRSGQRFCIIAVNVPNPNIPNSVFAYKLTHLQKAERFNFQVFFLLAWLQTLNKLTWENQQTKPLPRDGLLFCSIVIILLLRSSLHVYPITRVIDLSAGGIHMQSYSSGTRVAKRQLRTARSRSRKVGKEELEAGWRDQDIFALGSKKISCIFILIQVAYTVSVS